MLFTVMVRTKPIVQLSYEKNTHLTVKFGWFKIEDTKSFLKLN